MKTAKQDRLLFCAGASIVLLSFFRFAHQGLFSYFSWDDMMNLYYYWSRPVFRLVKSNVLFATDYYRPMGGLFYLGIYRLAGFHPLPFRIAVFGFLLANMWLLYKVAQRLSGTREVGAFAVLLSCFHVGMIDIYFDTGMAYDVLCYFFYFLTLLLYLRVRQSGRYPNVRETAAVLACYIACINSKEMGISLPLLIAAYEMAYHRPLSLRPRTAWIWLMHEGRTAMLSGIATVAFIIAKATGPESLANHPLYKPVISIEMYFRSAAYYMNILFYRSELGGLHFTPAWAALTLAAMLVAGLVLRSPHLVWSWALFAAGILPMAFVPPRGGFVMYLPAAGLGIYIASLIVASRRALLRLISPARTPRIELATQTGVFLFAALLVYSVNAYYIRWPLPPTLAKFDRIRKPDDAVRAALPSVPRGSKILFLNDGAAPDAWDLEFMLPLRYNDHSMLVHRVKRTGKAPGPQEIAAYDFVLDYNGDKYSVVPHTAAVRQ